MHAQIREIGHIFTLSIFQKTAQSHCFLIKVAFPVLEKLEKSLLSSKDKPLRGFYLPPFREEER